MDCWLKEFCTEADIIESYRNETRGIEARGEPQRGFVVETDSTGINHEFRSLDDLARLFHVGDEVSLYASLTAVGHASMRIRVLACRRLRTGEEHEQVTAAVFVYVALDEAGRPRPVAAARLEAWIAPTLRKTSS